MIETTYTSARYDAGGHYIRYVRYDGVKFHWCMMNPKTMLDEKQGTCDERDLPPDIAAKAKKRSTVFPSYVDWPKD